MTAYINWSNERLQEMIMKCRQSAADHNDKNDFISQMIRDMQDELDYRMHRVSDR